MSAVVVLAYLIRAVNTVEKIHLPVFAISGFYVLPRQHRIILFFHNRHNVSDIHETPHFGLIIFLCTLFCRR